MYESILNPTELYNLFFLSIKSITRYSSSTEFSENDENLSKIWDGITQKLYPDQTKHESYGETVYRAEFSCLHTISYAILMKNGTPRRKEISGSEIDILKTLRDDLNNAYGKNRDLILCGYNIYAFSIPYLMKKYMIYGINPPKIFKKQISAKPWEQRIADVMQLWKFNGYYNISLNALGNLHGIENNHYDLIDLSQKYWTELNEELIKEQAKVEILLLIGLMEKFRAVFNEV